MTVKNTDIAIDELQNMPAFHNLTNTQLVFL